MNSADIIVAFQDGSLEAWPFGDLYAAEQILKKRHAYLAAIINPDWLVAKEMSELTTAIEAIDLKFEVYIGLMLSHPNSYFLGMSDLSRTHYSY